ncbi:MAG TPA: hypothetical protein VMC02_05825 [Steroidobacteraceae bacterium]|nr:hypothetical protein [Steroidobacteraceae bacterium]
MIDSSNLPRIAAVTAIVAFGAYRRVRRSIGRQPLIARRQYIRMALVSLVCVALALFQPLQPLAVAYIASGIILGAAIGWFALRHTQFEASVEGYFYEPHLYIGIAVTALFIGRLLYRMLLVYDAANTAGGAAPMPDSTPLTLGILFLAAGYYIVYCTGLLRWLGKARSMAGARLSPGAPQRASSTSI